MIQGQTEVFVGKSVPVPFYLPRIPHGLGWDRTWVSEATERLSPGGKCARAQFEIRMGREVTIKCR